MIPEPLKAALREEGSAAFVTRGPDGPHLVATWNSYVEVVDERTLVFPAGGYRRTEENLRSGSPVQMIVGGQRPEGRRVPPDRSRRARDRHPAPRPREGAVSVGARGRRAPRDRRGAGPRGLSGGAVPDRDGSAAARCRCPMPRGSSLLRSCAPSGFASSRSSSPPPRARASPRKSPARSAPRAATATRSSTASGRSTTGPG